MDDLVLIHTAPSTMAGLLVKGRLESEDIPVFAKGEIEGPYRFGPIYLWVPRDVEVQARLIVAEMEAGGMALDAEDEAGAERTDRA
ncbi:MAG TPA: hypothetical protein VE646_01715 [Actinomycetota bacterium]|jgi:hypothetical protein|nr:hypothetical protein [Actinomycetota bacterium]